MTIHTNVVLPSITFSGPSEGSDTDKNGSQRFTIRHGAGVMKNVGRNGSGKPGDSRATTGMMGFHRGRPFILNAEIENNGEEVEGDIEKVEAPKPTLDESKSAPGISVANGMDSVRQSCIALRDLPVDDEQWAVDCAKLSRTVANCDPTSIQDKSQVRMVLAEAIVTLGAACQQQQSHSATFSRSIIRELAENADWTRLTKSDGIDRLIEPDLLRKEVYLLWSSAGRASGPRSDELWLSLVDASPALAAMLTKTLTLRFLGNWRCLEAEIDVGVKDTVDRISDQVWSAFWEALGPFKPQINITVPKPGQGIGILRMQDRDLYGAKAVAYATSEPEKLEGVFKRLRKLPTARLFSWVELGKAVKGKSGDCKLAANDPLWAVLRRRLQEEDSVSNAGVDWLRLLVYLPEFKTELNKKEHGPLLDCIAFARKALRGMGHIPASTLALMINAAKCLRNHWELKQLMVEIGAHIPEYPGDMQFTEHGISGAFVGLRWQYRFDLTAGKDRYDHQIADLAMRLLRYVEEIPIVFAMDTIKRILLSMTEAPPEVRERAVKLFLDRGDLDFCAKKQFASDDVAAIIKWSGTLTRELELAVLTRMKAYCQHLAETQTLSPRVGAEVAGILGGDILSDELKAYFTRLLESASAAWKEKQKPADGFYSIARYVHNLADGAKLSDTLSVRMIDTLDMQAVETYLANNFAGFKESVLRNLTKMLRGMPHLPDAQQRKLSDWLFKLIDTIDKFSSYNAVMRLARLTKVCLQDDKLYKLAYSLFEKLDISEWKQSDKRILLGSACFDLGPLCKDLRVRVLLPMIARKADIDDEHVVDRLRLAGLDPEKYKRLSYDFLRTDKWRMGQKKSERVVLMHHTMAFVDLHGLNFDYADYVIERAIPDWRESGAHRMNVVAGKGHGFENQGRMQEVVEKKCSASLGEHEQCKPEPGRAAYWISRKSVPQVSAKSEKAVAKPLRTTVAGTAKLSRGSGFIGGALSFGKVGN